MTLRNKVLLFAVLTATGLIVALYFGTANVLLGGFAQVEHNYIASQVRLVGRTFDAERDGLKAHVLGWSAWNDMYDFAATPDPTFARTELGADALGSMDIDFFIIIRPNGKILFSRLLGSLAGEAKLPEDMRAYLTSSNPILRHVSVHDVHTEMTVLSQKPVLIASAPIVTSEYEGPIRGSLIMGRFLNAQRLSKLRDTTGLPVSLYPIGKAPPKLMTSPKSAPIPNQVVGQLQNHEVIKGYTKLQDGTGRDRLLLEVTAPRPIYAQAVKSRTALLTVVVAISAIFVLLAIYLLHRSILARLAALNRGVQAITYEGSFSRRLELRGNDEFAKLATEINQMLRVLEETQRKAGENQARYTLVAQGINDGIWDRDLTTNETYYSARWRGMLGYPEEAVVRSADVAYAHIHPDDRMRVRSNIVAHLKGETPFFESEARMRLLDGSYRWMLMRGAASRDVSGRAVRMAGSLTDLTRRGVFDPLTGLPNRLLLQEHLDAALTLARAESNRLSAVLFMDIDRFKLVNDSLGHHVGDLLIIEVAKRLQGAIRPCDTVARLGGDEFVVLLDDLGSKADLERTVQRISGTVTTMLTLAGHQLNISISIGVIADLGAYTSVDDALRDADNAMYHAKATKRPFAYFDQRM
nr:diguanylate cyclase [Deinococcota bacterium]